MSEVLVIGDRNPDTDAICSAIGYAEFKRRTGMPRAVAARCGDTNERIDFVLQLSTNMLSHACRIINLAEMGPAGLSQNGRFQGPQLTWAVCVLLSN